MNRVRLLLLLAGMIVMSCSQSPEHRITGTWRIATTCETDPETNERDCITHPDPGALNATLRFVFHDNGSWIIRYSSPLFENDSVVGTWEFAADNDVVRLHPTSNGCAYDYDIAELTDTLLVLHLHSVSGGCSWYEEIHLEKE